MNRTTLRHVIQSLEAPLRILYSLLPAVMPFQYGQVYFFSLVGQSSAVCSAPCTHPHNKRRTRKREEKTWGVSNECKQHVQLF